MSLFEDPSEQTLAELLSVYEEAQMAFADEPPAGFVFTTERTTNQSMAALAVVANVILNLDAFITQN